MQVKRAGLDIIVCVGYHEAHLWEERNSEMKFFDSFDQDQDVFAGPGEDLDRDGLAAVRGDQEEGDRLADTDFFNDFEDDFDDEDTT